MPWSFGDLHPLFGAELSGVQLAADLAEEDRDALRNAIERHAVVVLRGQDLADSDMRRLVSSFGQLFRTAGIFEEADGVYPISNIDSEGHILPPDDAMIRFNASNEFWHTDSTYSQPRALFSFLYARTVPPVDGETEFCDTRIAYETLSPAEQSQLEGLAAHHSLIHSRSLTGFDDWTDEQRIIYAPVVRPVVQHHAGSGRKALCIASHISRIDPLSDGEGSALLAKLIGHSTTAERVYAHQWTPGDLVIWDNRCTMHRARPYAYERHVRDFRTARVLDMTDQ